MTLNGQSYQPNTTSLNKKEAKAAAAKHALQTMGFLQDIIQSQQQIHVNDTVPVPTPIPQQQIHPIQTFQPHQLSSFQDF